MAQEKNVDAVKEVFMIEDPSNLMELALKASLKFSKWQKYVRLIAKVRLVGVERIASQYFCKF